MATVSTPYATGTITSVNGTQTIISGGAVAGWVGRCIRIADTGAIRKITAFVSATEVTVDYAWNLSPFNSIGFTESNPSAGNTFIISYLMADIVDGTTVIADAGTLSYRFVGASTFSGGAFLYAANARIELVSSSIAAGSPTTDLTRCCFRFGDIDANGNTFNGCFVTDTATGPSGFGSGSVAARDPDFHFYAGQLRFTGAGPFWRFHSDANCTVRIIGSNIDGNIGGRMIGTKSIFKDWTVYNMASASGPFNPKAPFGLITNINVAKSLQGLYQYWPDSLTVAAEGIKPDTTVTKLVRFANINTTGQMLTMKDLDIATIQSMPLLYTNSTGTYSNTFRISQYLNASFVNAQGNLITDSTKFVVRDNVPTVVLDVVSTSGSIDKQTLRYRDMTVLTAGDYTWSSAGGTTYAPYAIAAISYNYKPASIPLPLLKSQSVNLVGLTDSNISQTNKATVDAYTAINNLDQLYDRCKSWSVDNLSAANPSFGAQVANANGSILNLGAFNLVVDSNAASVFDIIGSTITIKSSNLAIGTKFSSILTSGLITGGSLIAGNYTDSSGTFVNLTISNLTSGSRVQIYNSTDATELANFISSTSYSNKLEYTVDKTIRLRVTQINGVTSKDEYEAIGTLTSNGLSFTANQEDCIVYNLNGIDGSTVTEFISDYPNIQVDVNDADGETSLARLYAWYHYNITTADGIRNFFGGLDASDENNYVIKASVLNLKLDNTNASVPLKIIGGYISRDDGQTVIAATSNSIQMDPGKAYIANSSSITNSLGKIEPNTGLIPALL